METVNSVDRLPPSMIDKILEYKKAMDDTFLLEKKLGASTKYLDDVQVDYLMHMLTKDARQAVLRVLEPTMGTRKYTPAHASQLPRDLRGMDIDTINRLAQTGELPGKFAGIRVQKFFEDDLNAITAFRRIGRLVIGEHPRAP